MIVPVQLGFKLITLKKNYTNTYIGTCVYSKQSNTLINYYLYNSFNYIK